MATFAIESAVFSIDPPGSGAAVQYQATNVSLNYAQEALDVMPMDTAVIGSFPGVQNWSGSFSVLYDDTTGSPSPNTALFAGADGTLAFTMTDQTHTTPNTVLLTGEIVITATSVNFSMSEVPVLECTYLGSSTLTETPG